MLNLFFSPFALDQFNLQLLVGLPQLSCALGYPYLQGLFGLLEFLLFDLEFFINLDSAFVGRDQQIQNLLFFCGDEVRLATKLELHSHLQSFSPAQLHVR